MHEKGIDTCWEGTLGQVFIYRVLHRSLLDKEGQVLRGQITGSGHMASQWSKWMQTFSVWPQGENFRWHTDIKKKKKKTLFC